jgi:hypothetical protein
LLDHQIALAELASVTVLGDDDRRVDRALL